MDKLLLPLTACIALHAQIFASTIWATKASSSSSSLWTSPKCSLPSPKLFKSCNRPKEPRNASKICLSIQNQPTVKNVHVSGRMSTLSKDVRTKTLKSQAKEQMTMSKENLHQAKARRSTSTKKHHTTTPNLEHML